MMKSLLLFPLYFLYYLIVTVKNKLHDKAIFKPYKSKLPVVSIGNLTVGGTGKTPLTLDILRWAIEKGFKPAVVSRGYGRSTKGLHEVDLGVYNPALVFGDEPTLIKKKYPDIPVWVCEQRSVAVKKLEELGDVNLILADDAFQHRQLYRDIDVLVFDLTTPLDKYLLLPMGILREPLASVARADFALFNKVQFIAPKEVSRRKEWLSSGSALINIESRNHLGFFLENEKMMSLNDLDEVVLISGIGNPDYFHDLVHDTGLKIIKHFRYKDHYAFKQEDLEQISRLYPSASIITTEKDWVKLHLLEKGKSPIVVARLTTVYSEEMNKLYEAIDKRINRS